MPLEFFGVLILIMIIFYGIGYLHGRFPKFMRNGKCDHNDQAPPNDHPQ